jgi:CubicO group peptidase (beta-lactamase class C family)
MGVGWREVGRVVDMSAEAVCRQMSVSGSTLSGLLTPLVRKHRVPGAQLAVYRQGETAAVEVGELEVGSWRAVARSTAFPIGSVTKAFTATLVMVLVADDELSLDAAVGDYLPEVADLGAEFTVRRVLSHTSGLAADPRSEDAGFASLRRYAIDHCRPRHLLQPPGTGFSYSNMGYVLAGLLVEATTGMSWWEAMESILLRPLGIEPALVGARAPGGRGIASGHSVNTAAGRVRPVQQSVPPAEAPAGGLAVSATDLVSLARLQLRPGRPDLLPAGSAATMRQPVAGAEPFGLADGWGLGLAVYQTGAATWVGHDGNGDGTACYFRVDPDDDWAVALTSNANTGYGLWQDVLAELGSAGVPLQPHRPRTSRRPMRAPLACAGTYLNGEVEYQVTVRADGRLDLVAAGERVDPITCHDDLTFPVRDPAAPEQEVYGRFRRDYVTGAIYGVEFAGRIARKPTQPAPASKRRLTA